jgi:glycosyltransferase involved in cell wall biosynthesis
MKVLLVTSNLRGGGAQRAMINIAAGLAGRGHDSHLLLLEHAVEYPVPEDVKLHALSLPRAGMPSGWLGKRYLAWRLSRVYRSLAAEGEFDLVISTLPFADEVVQIAGLPRPWHRIANTLSAEIRALTLTNPEKGERRQERYRRIYDRQRLIAVSNGVAADLKENLGLKSAEIVAVYNPFDFESIRHAARALDPDLPNEDFVLHTGRFMPAKRHDLLLDAFAAAGISHRLVLLTAKSRELSTLIASRGLEARVVVAGFRANPYPWYARAAAVVLSSDREGMPNAIVEALVCGTPVVSTDCPSGPREVLTGSMRRWLVPCGDAVALAAKLRDAIRERPAVDPAMLAPFAKDNALDTIEALAARR